MTLWRWYFAGLTTAWLLLASCAKEGQEVARVVGMVEDERTVVLDGEPATITMGKGKTRVQVEFPANSVAKRTAVTVRVESNVARRGATPAGGAVVHIATQNLTFVPAARARQMAPPPPPMRAYVVVHSPSSGEVWAQRAPVRAVATLSPESGDAGDGGGIDDLTDQTYEMDITSSGLWAVALPDELTDGGVSSDGRTLSDGASTADAASSRSGLQLTVLEPAAGAAGLAVNLSLTGSGFDETTVAFFAGQKLTTTRKSAFLLTAEVPGSLTSTSGQNAVWVESGGASPMRSNVLYFLISAAVGAPVVVDYSPDNGVPGDKVLIAGRDLAGDALKITDSRGLSATVGAHGTASWWGATLETIEIVIPTGWQTGPITLSHAKGASQGKIFNVGKNLALLEGTRATASSEFSAAWSVPRGADNNLLTSWFSLNGDCATHASCTTTPWYQLTFATTQSVGRIAVRGNREYMSGYSFLRGRFEVLGTDNVVLWSASYDLPEPDNDLDIALPTPLAGVRAVKFTSEKDESVEPGLSELEVFAP